MDKRSADIIRSVRTPLGFFALIALVVEAILGIMINFTSGSDRTLLIVGMVVIIFLLIILVAIMAWIRPYSLYGRTIDEAGRVRADIVLMPTDEKKYDALFRGFTESDFYAFNPPFKVEGEPGEKQFQVALKAHEERYRSGVKSKYLFFDRDSYNRAQLFFQKLEQRLGADKTRTVEGEPLIKSLLWEKAEKLPGYTFFIGYKKKRPACILYPSVVMHEGRPELVVSVEGDDNLLSIMHRYFQDQWEQAARNIEQEPLRN